MDGHGFDLLTKRLALLITRRQGLRVLFAGAAAAGLLGLDMNEVAACGGAGKGCKKGKQCCSGICLRGRKKKGKKGRCDCSFPQEACNAAKDCCFPGSDCSDNGCDPGNNCCFGEGAECIDPCECCTGFTCDFAGGGEFGLCVPCRALQESCVVGDFCCDDGTFCDSNGSGEGDVCCLDAGFTCLDDGDCCAPRLCSSRADGTCQNCPALGEPCNAQNNTCCDKDAKCFDNAIGANNVCCLDEGVACQETSDCCEDHFCHPTEKTCRFDLGRRGPEADRTATTSETDDNQAARDRRSEKSRRSGKTSRKRRRRR